MKTADQFRLYAAGAITGVLSSKRLPMRNDKDYAERVDSYANLALDVALAMCRNQTTHLLELNIQETGQAR